MLDRMREFFGEDVAIDLGTSNTRISLAEEGIVVDEPSVIAVETDTRRVLSGGAAVGHLAKLMLGRTPDRISVVRPLRAGVIADFELCEAMLRSLLRKALGRRFGMGPRVLIAVPGSITPVEKRAVLNSAHRAGARQVFLLPEAKATALGIGLPIAEPVPSMICDIGGGTTEVAVLSMGDIVASESIRTAGDAMDQAIVDYLRRCYSLRVGLGAAEQLRIDIGSAAPLENELVATVSGVDTGSGLPRKANLTSEEVREALGDCLTDIVEAILRTIEGCSTELAGELVDHGIVLAGGGALVRGIDRFLAEQTGLPVRVASDPQTAVARGVQNCLRHFARWKNSLESGDDV